MNNNPADYGDDYNYDDNQRQQRHQRQQQRQRKQTKQYGCCLLRTIFNLVFIAVLVLVGYVTLVMFRINYSNDNPDTQYITNEVGMLKSSSDVQNIMIFGADNHAEGENGRSDSMILISIDKKHNTIKQTSFLRDLYLPIPEYNEDRLNSAFARGGAKLAVETIEYNFGIKIDSYAVVDFNSFTAIIDAMDGIDLKLSESEIDYINWQCWRNKQVETRNEIDIDEYTFYPDEDYDEDVAKVHLNGRQALWYARDRDSAGSDFDRTARQRIVINTVISQLKSSSPTTLMKVVYDVAPMLTTNMSKGEILSTGFGMISYLSYDRKEFTVPQSYNYSNTWIYDAQVLTIDDIDEEKQALYSFIFED